MLLGVVQGQEGKARRMVEVELNVALAKPTEFGSELSKLRWVMNLTCIAFVGGVMLMQVGE